MAQATAVGAPWCIKNYANGKAFWKLCVIILQILERNTWGCEVINAHTVICKCIEKNMHVKYECLFFLWNFTKPDKNTLGDWSNVQITKPN